LDTEEIALEFLAENSVAFPNVIDSSQTVSDVCGKYETLRGYSGVPFHISSTVRGRSFSPGTAALTMQV
jgi:hypothetical protein